MLFKAARPPRRTSWARLTAACSSDLRGERCNFVTMSNSYRLVTNYISSHSLLNCVLFSFY